MKRMLFVVLLLSGCAEGPTVLRQAQAVPGGAHAPPPSFSTPGYTPAGAGASPLGTPWQPPESRVERSPNKRVLPVDPTDPAPGLWAADAVKGSTPEYPKIADIEVPLADPETNGIESLTCAYKMNRLLKSEGQMSALRALRFDDQRCVVAKLFQYCWDKELAKAVPSPRRDKLEAGLAEVRNFLAYACRNTREGKQNVEKVVNAVTRAWELTERKRK